MDTLYWTLKLPLLKVWNKPFILFLEVTNFLLNEINGSQE